jgi:hypothetical protein
MRRNPRFFQVALGLVVLGTAPLVGAAPATSDASTSAISSEGRVIEPESLRDRGRFTLHAAPRALGRIEQGEARQALTAEDLRDMRISSPRSFGEAFAVRDLSEVSQVGLVLDAPQGARTGGRLKTALADLGFSSIVEADGKVRVEFDLGHDVVGMLIDEAEQTAVPLYTDATELAPADKFTLRALAVLLKKQGPAQSRQADLLLRTVNLFGELVPVGSAHAFFRGQVITPGVDRSWTTICGRTSASLCHDAASHSTLCSTVAVGPSAYRCRGRCGSGCDAYIGTSAWTIDCGEHDHCLESHYNGECFYCGDCGDEANSAQDDFLFAGNCSY